MLRHPLDLAVRAAGQEQPVFHNAPFIMGRIVTNADDSEVNEWLAAGKLAVSGRPLCNLPTVLSQRDIALLESMHPDEDIRVLTGNAQASSKWWARRAGTSPLACCSLR